VKKTVTVSRDVMFNESVSTVIAPVKEGETGSLKFKKLHEEELL